MEQWQSRGALYSSRPQHDWDLTIRLFSVIFRTLNGGGLTPLQRCSLCILLLYSHIRRHNTYTNICGNILKHNDDFNEWMNTLLYKKYTYHTLFSKGLQKGWCWLCVRGELETGTDCHILTQSSSDHSSTSFSSWLGCSTVGHWGPKPSVCKLIFTLASCPPTDSNCNWNWNSNWQTQAVCGTRLNFCLTPTCFLWAYASAPNSTTSTGQGDIPISLTGCTCFAVVLLIYTGASLDWRLGQGSICYTTAPADWAIHRVKCLTVLFQIIQFSITTQFKHQNSSVLSNSV